MQRVWVSVGSNIEREANIRAALRELRDLFGELTLSPVYETEAVGFAGEPFYNLVVGFRTALPPATLHGLMHAVEARHGRTRGADRFAPRTLDLDVLTYGDSVTNDGGKLLPRDEILHYAFVLAPLADVAGDEVHPSTGQTYGALWADFAELAAQGLQRLQDVAWLDD